MRRSLAVLLTFVLVLFACGDDDADIGTGAPDGDGTSTTSTSPTTSTTPTAEDGPVEYFSTSVLEDGSERPLVDGTRIRLTLSVTEEGPAIGANLGCNHLGGWYEVDDGVLIVENLAMTEMGCDPDRHAQDEWFVDLLSGRPSFTRDDTTVVLESGTTRVEFLLRSLADPDRPLLGTDWEATGFVDGATASAMAVERAGSITFDRESSTATGFDGCNAFSVPFEVDETDVRFGPFVGDDAYCEDVVVYVDAFQAIFVERVAFDINADVLMLTAPDGRAVTFRARG